MAYITIKTNTDESFITLQERVAPSDMESEFYRAHLVERLRWAVEDADNAASHPADAPHPQEHRALGQR